MQTHYIYNNVNIKYTKNIEITKIFVTAVNTLTSSAPTPSKLTFDYTVENNIKTASLHQSQ